MAYYKINGGYYEGSPGNITAVTNGSVLDKLRSGKLSSKKGKQDLFYDSSAGEDESSSSSGGSGRSSSNPDKYKYGYGGRSYENKADATAASRSDGGSSTSNTDDSEFDSSEVENLSGFKDLNADNKEAILAIFGVVAGNDKKKAEKMIEAFAATSALNDPYFDQRLRIATDTIERGYVKIGDEEDFREQQLSNRLKDFKKDYDNKKEFLTLEQASAMRGIERQYEQDLSATQQNLAASGFGSSSRRVKKEGYLNEATGDLRESTNRNFSYQQEQNQLNMDREARNNSQEVERLNELTAAGKLDFLRDAEAQVGSGNLPSLSGAPDELGDIYGSLPEEKLQNSISSATSFVF